MLFARNVQFEATFPDLAKNKLAIERHGDRLGLMKPDPALISRELFTRSSANDRNCKPDYTAEVWPNDAQPLDSNCDYVKAPFFNVIAGIVYVSLFQGTGASTRRFWASPNTNPPASAAGMFTSPPTSAAPKAGISSVPSGVRSNVLM